DPALIATNYNYVPADTFAGAITLRITSNLPGCLPVFDEMQISFGASPAANAGNDATICADAASVDLSGSVSVAGGGVWTTSGTGSFTPGTNILNPSYVPSA